MLALTGAVPVVAQGVTYRVGSDAACEFATIQPAIDAAQAHEGPDRVHIATNATYTAQALRIGNQDLTVEGGYATCAQGTPTSTTTVSGFGGAADSVVVITGDGDVSLSRLQIRDGDETNSGVGGGIDYDGTGLLTLSRMTIAQNRAGYGGGISFRGGFVLATNTLRLLGDVVVQNNVANGSGGGIRLVGGRLEISGDRIALLSNRALGNDSDSGFGGGLQVLGSSSAVISSNYLNFGIFAFNEAKYGAGMAVQVRSENARADIVLKPPSPGTPIRIHDNIASVAGGALYVDVPDEGDQRRVRVCVAGYRLDHNQAPAGAAVYVDGHNYNAAQLLLNTGVCTEAMPTTPPRCASGAAGCNWIDHNVVAQASGQPAAGAIVEMTKGRFDADGVVWIDNVGADILHALDNFQTPVGNVIQSCLIANNQLTGQTLAINDDTTLIRNCTIAGNTLGLSTVMTVTGALNLQDSIIWQPGKFSLGSAHGALTGGRVVTNDVASLAPLAQVVNRDPRFVDPGLGDYHLRVASPALDFAPATPGDDVDVDGTLRDRDLLVVNQSGPRDLGAYERFFLTPILLNGDFMGSLRHWTDVLANVASFDPNGGPGTNNGALAFVWDDPSSQSAFVRITSSAQCVHLPVPGTYRLIGSARTAGSAPPVSVQTAKLHWALRRDGGEACTQGPVSIPEAEGDLTITSGSTWASAATDEIRIDSAAWTPNSSLTVSTVMQSSAITATPRTHMEGWFDGILLELETDELLSDGFESP